MPTTFLNLPTTAANGPGTAVDVSAVSSVKTMANTGNGYVFEPEVTIEISNDVAGTNWVPIYTFANPGEVTLPVACRWMRATVANYKGGGAPQVDIGGDSTTISFTQLVAPAGNGAGAAVVTSAQPLFKTVAVTGTFRGTCNIEISEDGSTWTTRMSFTAPGAQSGYFTAQEMRVTRAGVPTVEPGLPLVDIAGDPSASGGGIDTSIAISAGTQSASTGTMVFSNSNNVSFGMSGSSQITASASFPAETPFGISAGTQSVSTGTLVFSNSNNVSFGMSGSNQVTASASFPAETPFGISAGTQSVSTGTLRFVNSNGVTFGMSGSSQITASVAAAAAPATYSQFTPFVGKILASYNPNQGSYWIAPYQFPNVAFSQFNAIMHHSNATNSTGTISFSYLLGIYTKNVSTLSVLHSSSFTSSIPYSGAASASNFVGYRVLTAPWTSSISGGDYWVGIGISTTVGSDNASIRLVCQDMAPIAGGATFSGLMGGASTVGQMALGLGAWSVGTGQVPSSVAFSDLRVTNMDRLCPAFALGITA